MAKLVGLVGSIVNKAGTFVFSTWKGIQVARAYQPNVSNPRSAGQTAQRTKFDYVIQYAIAMNRLPYLKRVWSLITDPHRTRTMNLSVVTSNPVILRQTTPFAQTK